MKRKRSRKALQAISANTTSQNESTGEDKIIPRKPPPTSLSQESCAASSTSTTRSARSIPLLDDSQAAFLTNNKKKNTNCGRDEEERARVKKVAKTTGNKENERHLLPKSSTALKLMPFTSRTKTPKISNVTLQIYNDYDHDDNDDDEKSASEIKSLHAVEPAQEKSATVVQEERASRKDRKQAPDDGRDATTVSSITVKTSTATSEQVAKVGKAFTKAATTELVGANLDQGSTNNSKNVANSTKASGPPTHKTELLEDHQSSRSNFYRKVAGGNEPTALAAAASTKPNVLDQLLKEETNPCTPITGLEEESRSRTIAVIPPTIAGEQAAEGEQAQSIKQMNVDAKRQGHSSLETPAHFLADMETATMAGMETIPSLHFSDQSPTEETEVRIKTRAAASALSNERMPYVADDEVQFTTLAQRQAIARKRAMTPSFPSKTGEPRENSVTDWNISDGSKLKKDFKHASPQSSNQVADKNDGRAELPTSSDGARTPTNAAILRADNLKKKRLPKAPSKKSDCKFSALSDDDAENKENRAQGTLGDRKASLSSPPAEDSNNVQTNGQPHPPIGSVEHMAMLKDIVLKTPSAIRSKRFEPPPLVQPLIAADFVEQYRRCVPDNKDVLKKMLGSLGSINSVDRTTVFGDLASPKRELSGMVVQVRSAHRRDNDDDDEMSEVTCNAFRKRPNKRLMRSKALGSCSHGANSSEAVVALGASQDFTAAKDFDATARAQTHPRNEKDGGPSAPISTSDPPTYNPNEEAGHSKKALTVDEQPPKSSQSTREGKKSLDRLRQTFSRPTHILSARASPKCQKHKDDPPHCQHLRVLANTKMTPVGGRIQGKGKDTKSTRHSSQVKRDPPQVIETFGKAEAGRTPVLRDPPESSVSRHTEWSSKQNGKLQRLSKPENAQEANLSEGLEFKTPVISKRKMKTNNSNSNCSHKNFTKTHPVDCSPSVGLSAFPNSCGHSPVGEACHPTAAKLPFGTVPSAIIPPISATPPSPEEDKDTLLLRSTNPPTEIALLPWWTAALSGFANVTPIIRLGDGRQFRHTPLPPGWTITLSKTSKRPYYKHPDLGTTFYPPVLMPSADGSIHSKVIYFGTGKSPTKPDIPRGIQTHAKSDCVNEAPDIYQNVAPTPFVETQKSPQASDDNSPQVPVSAPSSSKIKPHSDERAEQLENQAQTRKYPVLNRSIQDSSTEEIEVARCAKTRSKETDQPLLLSQHVEKKAKKLDRHRPLSADRGDGSVAPVVWNDSDSPLPSALGASEKERTAPSPIDVKASSVRQNRDSTPPGVRETPMDDTTNDLGDSSTHSTKDRLKDHVNRPSEIHRVAFESETRDARLSRRLSHPSTATPTTAYLSSRASSVSSARLDRPRFTPGNDTSSVRGRTPKSALSTWPPTESSPEMMRRSGAKSGRSLHDVARLSSSWIHEPDREIGSEAAATRIENVEEHYSVDLSFDCNDYTSGDEASGGGKGSAYSSLQSFKSVASWRVLHPARPLCCLQNLSTLDLTSSTKKARKKQKKLKKKRKHKHAHPIPRSIGVLAM
ncbi:hypothetical protein ACA910_000267 [Epithemia clementina (nom. ined.)]